MRFIVKHKADHGDYYSITLGNRPDEERYKIVGIDEELDIHIEKSARFSSAEKNGLTPEEDNKRWFDSFQVGSEFNLSPKVAE